MKPLLHDMGQCRFARAGEAGKPEHYALVVVLRLAALSGDGGMVPDGIAAFHIFLVCFLGAVSTQWMLFTVCGDTVCMVA